MAKNDLDSGCGCLILIIIAIAFGINKCTESNTSADSSKDSALTSQSKPSSYYDTQQAASSAEELSEEDKEYLSNSLETGVQPYSDFYGESYVCTHRQCSAIEVTAPVNSDIIVIIKRNNDNGKVISHAYIAAGEKYTFDLPNGVFQPFFYYGEGWNPNKDMGNGVIGGFVQDESFSKDSPQKIVDCVLSYVLQLRKDGNFQTEGSSRSEMF